MSRDRVEIAGAVAGITTKRESQSTHGMNRGMHTRRPAVMGVHAGMYCAAAHHGLGWAGSGLAPPRSPYQGGSLSAATGSLYRRSDEAAGEQDQLHACRAEEKLVAQCHPAAWELAQIGWHNIGAGLAGIVCVGPQTKPAPTPLVACNKSAARASYEHSQRLSLPSQRNTCHAHHSHRSTHSTPTHSALTGLQRLPIVGLQVGVERDEGVHGGAGVLHAWEGGAQPCWSSMRSAGTQQACHPSCCGHNINLQMES